MENIIDKMDVKDATKKDYKIKLKKILSFEIDPKSDQTDIVNRIKSLKNEKNENILSYINICIVIRKSLELDNELLKKYRTDKNKEMKSKQTETNKELNNSLKDISIEELHEHLESLYKAESYNAYIINYLIINFSTRNKDLDLILTKTCENEDEDNFLIIRSKDVKFIRNNYKTAETYGKLKNLIKDKKFIDACKKLIGDKKEIFLISTKNGDRIKDWVGEYIKERTYLKLGQSKIFKIILKTKTKSELLNIKNKRGTNPATMLEYYDVNRVIEENDENE
jgi:hypothetical protein